MFFIFHFHFSTSFRTIAGQCGHCRPPTRTWVTAGTAAVAPVLAPSPAQRTDPVAPPPPPPPLFGARKRPAAPQHASCRRRRRHPPPLVPCKLLAPHLRHPSAPAPHPSSLASPHCRLRTAARKFVLVVRDRK